MQRRKQAKLHLDVGGATTTVTMGPSRVGWEVKGWTYQIGDIKTYAEGEPYLHDTYGSHEEAYTAFQEASHLALADPVQYQAPVTPMVDITTQTGIDAAATADKPMLDTVFTELKRQT